MNPTVSVVIPSYNHERFIHECIQSVLDQTFQDFEIIITDDASSDGTVEVIKRFTDHRIKLFRHTTNKGASIAANHCISHASGKYIAMLNSDDVWYSNKLDVQVNYLEKHPEIGAVFGGVDWVDEKSQPITNKNFHHKDLFDVNNKTRFEWLRYFFFNGNRLCHPCSLVRKECYQKIGLFNPVLANLPDFDLWIRLCLHYEIIILDGKFIKFRKMTNEENASGDTNSSRVRYRFEYRQILNNYLQINDPQNFLRVFPEAVKYGKITIDTIPFVLGKISIDHGADFAVLLGLDLIYNALKNEKIAEIIEIQHNFTYRDFIELSGKCDPFRVSDFFPVQPPPQVVQKNAHKMFLSATKDYARALKFILKKFQ